MINDRQNLPGRNFEQRREEAVGTRKLTIKDAFKCFYNFTTANQRGRRTI